MERATWIALLGAAALGWGTSDAAQAPETSPGGSSVQSLVPGGAAALPRQECDRLAGRARQRCLEGAMRRSAAPASASAGRGGGRAALPRDATHGSSELPKAFGRLF
jgi:hypothetical protein